MVIRVLEEPVSVTFKIKLTYQKNTVTPQQTAVLM
jgi:hypothetical protein